MFCKPPVERTRAVLLSSAQPICHAQRLRSFRAPTPRKLSQKPKKRGWGRNERALVFPDPLICSYHLNQVPRHAIPCAPGPATLSYGDASRESPGIGLTNFDQSGAQREGEQACYEGTGWPHSSRQEVWLSPAPTAYTSAIDPAVGSKRVSLFSRAQGFHASYAETAGCSGGWVDSRAGHTEVDVVCRVDGTDALHDDRYVEHRVAVCVQSA